MKKVFLTLAIAAAAGACTSAGAPSANSNSTNQPANLPPEFSGRTATPGNEPTPGIPAPNQANLSNVPPGQQPAGIPTNANLNKPFKPGLTPTPGIPSEKEIKEQMSRPVDANAVNRPAPNQKFNDGEPPLKQVRKP